MSLAGRIARIPVFGAIIIAASNIKFLFTGSLKSTFLQAKASDGRLDVLRVHVENVSSRLDRVAVLEAALRAIDEKVSQQNSVLAEALKAVEEGRLHELERAYLGLNHFVRQELAVKLDGIMDSARGLSHEVLSEGFEAAQVQIGHGHLDQAMVVGDKSIPHLSGEDSKAISKDASELHREQRFNRVADTLRGYAIELDLLRKELAGLE